MIEHNEKDESFAINKMIMQTDNLPHPTDMDTSFAASIADSRYIVQNEIEMPQPPKTIYTSPFFLINTQSKQQAEEMAACGSSIDIES